MEWPAENFEPYLYGSLANTNPEVAKKLVNQEYTQANIVEIAEKLGLPLSRMPQVANLGNMNSGQSSFREWRDPQTSVTTNTTLNLEEQSLLSGIRIREQSLSLGSRDSVKSRGTRTPFLPAS